VNLASHFDSGSQVPYFSDASEAWPRFIHLNISDEDPVFPETAPGTWNFPQTSAVYAGKRFSQPGRKGADFHPAFPGTAWTDDCAFIVAGWTFYCFRHFHTLNSSCKTTPKDMPDQL
jgi:hypothetical protein